jgi:hypothetical protein
MNVADPSPAMSERAQAIVTLGGTGAGTVLHFLGFDSASEFSWLMAGTLSALLIIGWLWDRGKEAWKIWRLWRRLKQRDALRRARRESASGKLDTNTGGL